MKFQSIFKILFVTITLFLSGCEDYLDKDPIGLLTPEQVNTDPSQQSIISTVNSSYELLSNTLNIVGQWDWSGGKVLRNDFILQDIAAGDMQKKWNPDGDQAWIDEVGSFNFTATNGAFNGIWSYNYEGISRANLAISYLTNSDILSKVNMNSSMADRLLGEAYFLRGFYYFDLVVHFGDIPLLTKPLINFSEAYDIANRVETAKIWEQIETDFSQAETLLPPTKYADEDERWRASQGAALAMMAKKALYLEKWEELVSIVSTMKGLGYYSLNDNYFDNFDVQKEYDENEVIFSYDHQSNQTPRRGNGLNALMGWGFIAPTIDFVNDFEENDPRLLFTIDRENEASYKLLGDLSTRYKGNDDAPGNRVFIRWADVLLWQAEAYMELGNLTESVRIINVIRSRARNTPTVSGELPPAGTLPDRDESVSDKDQLHDWLNHERRVELGFESQRFNDLKRWEIAKQVLTDLGKNFQDENYLYPIPQGEIDKSGGSITQNTGY